MLKSLLNLLIDENISNSDVLDMAKKRVSRAISGVDGVIADLNIAMIEVDELSFNSYLVVSPESVCTDVMICSHGNAKPSLEKLFSLLGEAEYCLVKRGKFYLGGEDNDFCELAEYFIKIKDKQLMLRIDMSSHCRENSHIA